MTPRVLALIAAIDDRLAWQHDECDDCWYSCPKSGECCDDRADKTKCRCGKDALDAILIEVKAILCELADSSASAGYPEEGRDRFQWDGADFKAPMNPPRHRSGASG